MDINTDAPVITRDQIVIDAPVERIWEIQTDVPEWPSWQSDVDGAEAEGPLGVGSVFRWQTAGLDITSTVEETDEPHRIVWGGPAQGIVAVHVWTFEPQEDGVLTSPNRAGMLRTSRRHGPTTWSAPNADGPSCGSKSRAPPPLGSR